MTILLNSRISRVKDIKNDSTKIVIIFTYAKELYVQKLNLDNFIYSYDGFYLILRVIKKKKHSTYSGIMSKLFFHENFKNFQKVIRGK